MDCIPPRLLDADIFTLEYGEQVLPLDPAKSILELLYPGPDYYNLEVMLEDYWRLFAINGSALDISRTGLLSSEDFEETIAEELGKGLALNVRQTVGTSALMWTQVTEFCARRRFERARRCRTHFGRKTLQDLERILRPTNLAALRQDQLKALVLVLVGMTLAVQYTWKSILVHGRAHSDWENGDLRLTIERAQIKLVRLFSHFLLLLFERAFNVEEPERPHSRVHSVSRLVLQGPLYSWHITELKPVDALDAQVRGQDSGNPCTLGDEPCSECDMLSSFNDLPVNPFRNEHTDFSPAYLEVHNEAVSTRSEDHFAIEIPEALMTYWVSCECALHGLTSKEYRMSRDVADGLQRACGLIRYLEKLDNYCFRVDSKQKALRDDPFETPKLVRVRKVEGTRCDPRQYSSATFPWQPDQTPVINAASTSLDDPVNTPELFATCLRTSNLTPQEAQFQKPALWPAGGLDDPETGFCLECHSQLIGSDDCIFCGGWSSLKYQSASDQIDAGGPDSWV